MDNQNLINERGPDSLIILKEIDVEKEVPHGINCGILFPLTNFICPPLGTIIFTICYFKYLKVLPAFLLLIHLSISSLAIASFFFIDIEDYELGTGFFLFGLLSLPIIGSFGGAALVGILWSNLVKEVYDEKMIIF